jgi:hypothetical protein
VASIAGIEPELAPLKELSSPPIGLPDEPSIMLESATPPRPDDPDPVSLTLRGPASIDAQTPNGISITATLHNAGKRPVVVRFRPETLRFEVTGPRGADDCRWPVPPVAAMRELFTTLAPGGNAELSVLLGAYCQARSFDEPGLVIVRPELDTRRASGADIALRTFDGRVLASSPVIVRLHQGSAPRRLQRPRLEPLPAQSPAPSASSLPAASATAPDSSTPAAPPR